MTNVSFERYPGPRQDKIMDNHKMLTVSGLFFRVGYLSVFDAHENRIQKWFHPEICLLSGQVFDCIIRNIECLY